MRQDKDFDAKIYHLVARFEAVSRHFVLRLLGNALKIRSFGLNAQRQLTFTPAIPVQHYNTFMTKD